MDSRLLKKLATALLFAATSLGFVPSASAGLIFDRGLPTTNLNNAAGASRSNVAWADGDPLVISIGDNFTIGSAIAIDTIRVWVVGKVGVAAPGAGAFTLWLGPDPGPVSSLVFSTSVTSVTYADMSTYQGSSGAFRPIYQVDFSGIDLWTPAGTYAFGVAGPNSDGYPQPFLHASNGPLSGSLQMGSDGSIYGFDSAGLMVTGYPWASTNGGWDKDSDVNVQVFGVPEPSTIALIGIALLSLFGFGLMRRRQDV